MRGLRFWHSPIEDIIRGLKISYWACHQQAYLDAEVRGDMPSAAKSPLC
jgi:hypothetical protein